MVSFDVEESWELEYRMKRSSRLLKSWRGLISFLKTAEDAQKAMHLILRKTAISSTKEFEGLKDITISQAIEHASSAVEYQTYYEVEIHPHRRPLHRNGDSFD